MAGKMLLVNPRKRRTRRKTTARKKTPARRRTTRRAAPKRTTRAVRRRTRSAPARRRRRNPARRGVMNQYLRPALMGGGTAVGIDVAMGYVPLPDVLSTGMARHAAKAAAAIGLGMIGPKIGIKRATCGAVTVYTADLLREGVQTYLPNVALGYYSPAYIPPGQDGMNEYLSGGSTANPLGYESGPDYESGLNEYMEPDTSMIY